MARWLVALALLGVDCKAKPSAVASGVVVEVRGEASINGAAAEAGQHVKNGDSVVVKAGRLELDLDAVGKVRVFPNTSLVLDARTLDTGQVVTVRLAFGLVWSVVTKLAGSQRYEVESPNAVCGVRGTEFAVEATGDDSDVRVSSGQVEVANKRRPAEKRVVKAGQKTRVVKHEAPTEPQRQDNPDRDRIRWDDIGRDIKEGLEKAGKKIKELFK